jgi:hypothetical protein
MKPGKITIRWALLLAGAAVLVIAATALLPWQDLKRARADALAVLQPDSKPKPKPKSCAGPDCPLPPRWQPEIQRGNDYSEPGVCTDEHISYDAEVTLSDGERLDKAANRLAAAVKAAAGTGGRILVPWDVETVQCDSLRMSGRQTKVIKSFALSGVRGPKGELPRFYCRADRLGGTVTKGFGGPFWRRAPANTLMENIEIDGYGSWFNTGYTGKSVVRNSYLHDAVGNGIGNSGLDWERAGRYGPRSAEFCGNNISRGGSGNTKHCFYLKRGLPGEESSYTLVDNVIHSCHGSEGFKSTGEEHLIAGNRFYKTVPPDEFQPDNPAWKIEEMPGRANPSYTSTSLNIPACANNIVRNNLFHAYRPEPTGYANGIIVQIVGRRGIQGCDRPRGYIGNNVKAVPDYSSEFWDKRYWDSIAGTFPFKTEFSGNTVELAGPVHGDAQQNPKGKGVVAWGTYPAIAAKAFGSSCLLQAPPFWRERSRLYARGNRWIGWDLNPNSERLSEMNKGHTDYDPVTGTDKPGGKCLLKGYPYPSSADLRRTTRIVELE